MEDSKRGKLIALITGIFSILIGLLYLIIIILLDFRGPILPPPPEALIEVVTPFLCFFVMAL